MNEFLSKLEMVHADVAKHYIRLKLSNNMSEILNTIFSTEIYYFS